MKKTIKLILSIFLIAISIYILYCKFILKQSIIKIFGFAFLIVTTGSMSPQINPGELIIIKEYTNYQVGDIVTYKVDDEHLITHRIIEKQDNQIITKGDFNNIVDDPININQIQGKVIYQFKVLNSRGGA